MIAYLAVGVVLFIVYGLMKNWKYASKKDIADGEDSELASVTENERNTSR